ncbi:MAG: hypothetical protein AAGD10_18220 [Myxococcota bacterium]
MRRGEIAQALVIGLLCAHCSSSDDPDGGNGEARDAGSGNGTAQDALPPDSGVGGNQAFEVQSEGGGAVLRIGADTLPDGIDPASIRVIEGIPGASLDSQDGLQLIRAFTLEPDGLQFSQPAELELTIDAPGLLAGVLVSGDRVEGVPLRATDAARSGPVVLEIPHFSGVFVLNQPELVGGVEVIRDLSDTSPQAPTEALLAASPLGGLFEGSYIDDGLVQPALVELDLRFGVKASFEIQDLNRLTPVGLTETRDFNLPASWEPRFRCMSVGTMSANAFVTFDTAVARVNDGPVVPASASSRPTMLSAECTDFAPDPTNDCADSLGPETECSFFDDLVDIIGSTAVRQDFSPRAIQALFGNTAYPCNEVEDGVRTVCPADPEPFPSGATWVFRTELAAPVPDANPTHSLIYALVLETDLDPENDWVPRDPFIWDYFQGADRWYQLNWDHIGREWSVTATQVDSTQGTMQVSTAARAVISANVITWYVPSTEVARPTPDYRLTAFAHDGQFSENDRGGNVTGSDPTAPLRSTSL